MPDNLKNAVVAIEDKNFWTEPGINLKGTIGAALNAFTGNRIWGTNRGASTLEQQLIKNLTGDNEQDNMRKVREIFRALGLDNKYSKETIRGIPQYDPADRHRTRHGGRLARVFRQACRGSDPLRVCGAGVHHQEPDQV